MSHITVNSTASCVRLARHSRTALAACGGFTSLSKSALCVLIAIAPLACSTAASPDSELPTGTIAAHLDQIPPQQYCLKLDARSTVRTESMRIDVTPGQADDFLLERIPVGSVTFTGYSYATACANVAGGAIPDYVSDPMTVLVGERDVAAVTLMMKHNGRAAVDVDWEDACPSGDASIAPMKLLPQGFCIDTTEVTRAEYAAWLRTNPATTQQATYCAWNTSFSPDTACLSQAGVCQTGCDEHPQVCVDWCDAAAYCTSVGKRLCGKIGGGANAFLDHDDASKSQWYAACTSNAQYLYSYGNNWDGNTGAVAVCNDWAKSRGTTAPVGSSPACTSPDANYSGVYDLTGNVWEWEDSCNGAANGADACRIRGGAYVNCYGAGSCDYPYNDDRCSYSSASDGTGGNDNNPTLQRSAFDGVTGFRCCS
jgi:formylglycine-generating enzyme